MATTTNATTVMIEQALICAAKYRLLALSESDQLMIRLFEENALRLERTAGALKNEPAMF